MRINHWGKKTVVLALALSLVLSLPVSAAGGGGRYSRRASRSRTKEETGQETEEKKEQAPAAEQPEEEELFPELQITREVSFIDPEDGQYDLMIEYPVFDLAGETYGELAKALRENSALMGEAFGEIASDMSAFMEREGRKGNAYCGATASAVRADEDVVSIRIVLEMQLAEEDSSFIYANLNLDPETGKELGIQDAVADQEALVRALMGELFAAYPDEGFDENMEDNLAWLIENDKITWNIGHTAFLVEIPENTLTSSGKHLFAAIPYADYPDLVDSRYTAPADAWIEPLLPEYRYRTGAEGKILSAKEGERSEESSECGVFYSFGNAITQRSYYAYMPDMYLVHEGKQDWLYVTVPYGDITLETEVFDLSGGTLSEPKTADLAFTYGPCPTDPSRMRMSGLDRENMPVSYVCRPGEDGIPEIIGNTEDTAGTGEEGKAPGKETESRREAAAEEAENAILSVGIFDSWNGHHSENIWFDGSYDRMTCPEGSEALQEALSAWNASMEPRVDEYLDSYEALARQMEADGALSLETGPLGITARLAIQRSDRRVLSAAQTWNRRGLNGMGGQKVIGVNFDPETGKMFSLEDAVKDLGGLAEAVKAEIAKTVPNEEFDYPPSALVDDLFASDDLTSTEAFSWTLGYEGITFYFNTEINFAYFGATGGTMRVFIPYAKDPALFEDWVMEVPERYGYSTGLSGEIPGEAFVDADGDGTWESVTVVRKEEDGYVTGIDLFVGENYTSFDFGGMVSYETDAYIIHTGGQNFLWVDQLNEDPRLSVYSLNEEPSWMGDFFGRAVFTAVGEGAEYEGDDLADNSVSYQPLDPANVMLAGVNYQLGMRWVMREYDALGSGWPTPKEDVYQYLYYYETVTAKKDLEFDGTPLKKGESARLIQTDGYSYIILENESGQRFRIPTRQEGYTTYVGEDLAGDLFEGVYYH